MIFILHLLFASILVMPIKSQLDGMFSHSLAGEKIIQKSGGANYVFEFLIHNAEALAMEQKLLLLGGFVFLGVIIFLNGGIIGCFSERKQYDPGLFFQKAGYYFGRFFKLFLWSLLFYILIFLLFAVLAKLVKSISGDSEPLFLLLTVVNFLILFILVFFVRMVFDYSKIAIVSKDRKKIINTNLLSWRFVLSNPGRTLGLYYLIFFMGVVFFIIFITISGFFGISSWIAIILLFIWQQIFTAVRIGIRLLFFASQNLLYQSISEPLLKAWYTDDAYIEKII